MNALISLTRLLLILSDQQLHVGESSLLPIPKSHDLEKVFR
jgi:hypothetical protein